jgi:hypothetical protein
MNSREKITSRNSRNHIIVLVLALELVLEKIPTLVCLLLMTRCTRTLPTIRNTTLDKIVQDQVEFVDEHTANRERRTVTRKPLAICPFRVTIYALRKSGV